MALVSCQMLAGLEERRSTSSAGAGPAGVAGSEGSAGASEAGGEAASPGGRSDDGGQASVVRVSAAVGGRGGSAGEATEGGTAGAAGNAAGGTEAGGAGGTEAGGLEAGGATASGGAAGGTEAGGAETGGAATGGVSTGNAGQAGADSTVGGAGGAAGTGGHQTGATGAAGDSATGGASTGGAGGSATGGRAVGGSSAGGSSTAGAPTGGASTGGFSTGGAATGGAPPVTGPCDIYASASTPCVAAYSMVRVLSSTYDGPLYQVRKGGSNLGSGGTTQDIEATGDGFGDAAAQDSFCGTEPCTVSKLYDQSGQGNDLVVAKKGCYTGTAAEDDYESDAKKRSLMVGGHRVYALYMVYHEGYRNNEGTGIPIGSAAQGIYEVADGKRGSPGCCWDFGNTTTDNCYGPTGTTNALFFGVAYWGSGAGAGPWFMADFDTGIWSGGTEPSGTQNDNLPSSNMDYAFGILKTHATNYAIRVGDAQSGTLTTGYDGNLPFSTWQMQGGIVLGIASDNTNTSLGTFFEGAMTAGRPSDVTDDAVLQNVQAAGYGQ